MATQRYISTSFWDDRWIRSINPADRYLYLYLMTNPLTNIAGVYEVTIDRIAFDTGYDERTLRPMLEKFAKAGKAHFHNEEWIILPSWPRHQKFNDRSKIRNGIDSILLELPESVYQSLTVYNYQYTFLNDLAKKRPFKAHEDPSRPSNYSDSDSDLDSDLDSSDGDSAAPQEDPGFDVGFPDPPAPSSKPAPQKDPLAQQWEDSITAIQPRETWSDYGKERKQCRYLAQRTRGIIEKSPYETGEEVIHDVLGEYQKLRRKNRAPYWSGAAVTPSAIMTRWPDIWTSLAQSHADEEVITF